ncbi:MAG: DNA mismatch repair protein MutS [Phycisphaerae bacterium]|nr:DNA mismatch repair protein MutS [Phycisphaerae bacterium]
MEPAFTDFQSWLGGFHGAARRHRDEWHRRESTWSWTRLLTFVIVVLPWFFYNGNVPLTGGIALVGLIAFVASVVRHLRVRAVRDQADRTLVIIAEAQQRAAGEPVTIRSASRPADAEDVLHSVLDPGPTWPLTDQERDDLDVYATPLGLFSLLNRTSTHLGALRLRDALDHPLLAAAHIRARQESVRWLAQQHAARMELLAAAAQLRGHDAELAQFIRAVRETRALHTRPPIRVLRWLSIPTFLVTVVALSWTGGGSALLGLLLILAVLVVSSFLLALAAGPMREFLALWQSVGWAARGYGAVAQTAARLLPADAELAQLRERLARAAPVLPSLARRIAWSESGGIVHAILNRIVFWDAHVVGAILHRALPHRDELVTGLSALADLETLLSLACYAAEQPGAVFPRLSDEYRLQLASGRHPLIPPAEAVGNSLDLDARVRTWIITGSNMAGKSTFLRMTGANVLLAQCGGAVLADEMCWAPVRLISDLRARDNLARHESYFMAEVRQLRRMVLPPAGPTPILGLIDEPFRGTNSTEQTAASVAVARHLLRSTPHFFLLATHDRALTELADGDSARNFHFREDLGSHGLVFDYRIRSGPAHTRNALRILEHEGYPEPVIRDAHDRVAHASPDAARVME